MNSFMKYEAFSYHRVKSFKYEMQSRPNISLNKDVGTVYKFEISNIVHLTFGFYKNKLEAYYISECVTQTFPNIEISKYENMNEGY